MRDFSLVLATAQRFSCRARVPEKAGDNRRLNGGSVLASENGQPRRTQAERRREAETGLVDAAIELIARKGFDRFTLAEVGEAAGFSRGLPVHYFGTKENLLIKVAERIVVTYRLGLNRLPTSPRGLPRLTQIILDYAKPSKSPSSRAMSMLISHAALHAELGAAIAALNARGLKVLEDEIQSGVEAGNIRRDADAKLVARFIFSFLRGQASFSMLDPKFESTKVAEEFARSLEAHLAMPVPRPTAGPTRTRAAAGEAATKIGTRRAPAARR